MWYRARHCCFLTIVCAAVCFQTKICFAQVQPWDAEPRKESVANADEQGAPVWTITPAAEPQPALRHRLWPAPNRLVPGNAMVPVHRAMVMMLEKRAASSQPSAFTENYELWMEGPLDQLPKDDVAKYLQANRDILDELHRMEKMREAEYDLGVADLQGNEAIQLRLPEIQNSRELARLLALEARLAMAEGRFDDVIRTLTTGIRLGDSIGATGDLLVIKLVSIAITSVMLEQAGKASELPDAPNLYWALATVPKSTYEIRSAIEFESSFASRVFPSLTDLPREPANAFDWRERLVSTVQGINDLASSPAPSSKHASASTKLFAGLVVLGLAEHSRHQLAEDGYDRETVEQMSPAEAVVRATTMSVERIEHNLVKWVLLPDSLHEIASQRSEGFEQQQLQRGFPSDLASSMANLLLPATRAAQSAERRTAQTIARLATVEAIRDYAATHEQLPANLEELSNLPAWPHPVTGEPFGYTRSSPTEARLTSTPSYPGDNKANVILRLVLPDTSP